MKFRSLVIFALIAVFLAAVFMQAQGALEIRAASQTAVAGWQQMSTPAGEAVWVSTTAALTTADIARGEPRIEANGQRTVGVVFTADGARKMAQLSAAQANRPIALLLDGKVVWAPIVRGTIEKEAVLSGVTPDVVQRVLTSLKQ
jgi:preprotein translocase subunit SecD